MRISIITVCRNVAGTIADAVRSVRAQTYSNLELIVVDGASTDETVQVVRRETRDFPHLFRLISEPDRGMYDALRKGVAAATGDVVGILNADDFMESPEAIGFVAAAFDSETDAVIGDVVMAAAADPLRIVRYYSARNFKREKLLRGEMPPHAGFYARRELFEKIGSYSADYRLAGDFELMVRFFLKYPLRFKYLPRVIVRMRTGGMSNRSIKSRLRLNQEVIRALRDNGFPSGWFRLLMKVPAKVLQYFVRPRE